MTVDPAPDAEQPRGPLSRQLIVEAAREMVSASGVEGLSLRRLAARLGVTAPALYAHVTDKDDLLRAIADLGYRDLAARYRAVEASEESDLLERLRALSHTYVEHALADPEVFRLMFRFRPHTIELGSFGDQIDNVLTSADDAFEFPFAEVCRAIEAGVIHPDRDPLVTALVLWTATHGAADVLLLGLAFDDAAGGRLVDDVVDATLAGLALPPR